jgi:hypothetical protein
MKKLAIVGLLSLLARPAWAQDQLDIGRDGVTTGQLGGQSFSGRWDRRSGALDGEIDGGYKFRAYYNPSTGRVYGDIPDPDDGD